MVFSATENVMEEGEGNVEAQSGPRENQNFTKKRASGPSPPGSALCSAFDFFFTGPTPAPAINFFQSRHASIVSALTPLRSVQMEKKAPAALRRRGQLAVSSSSSMTAPSKFPSLSIIRFFFLASSTFFVASNARELRRARLDPCAPTEVRIEAK